MYFSYIDLGVLQLVGMARCLSHTYLGPTIVSMDADVNKFILQSDANVFVPSYRKALTKLMGKSSILLINGSLQRRIHGLIGAFFKSP